MMDKVDIMKEITTTSKFMKLRMSTKAFLLTAIVHARPDGSFESSYVDALVSKCGASNSLCELWEKGFIKQSNGKFHLSLSNGVK